VNASNAEYASVDGVLYDKTVTTLIQCPGGKAGSFTIPASVTTIGARAFAYCTSLANVTVPSSVTHIEWYAFLSCTNLTQLHFEGNAPYCEQMWIENHNSDLTIYYFGNNSGFSTPTWNGIRSVSLPVRSSTQDLQIMVIIALVAIFALLMVAFVIMRKHKVKK
jgi:hypothetical protein